MDYNTILIYFCKCQKICLSSLKKSVIITHTQSVNVHVTHHMVQALLGQLFSFTFIHIMTSDLCAFPFPNVYFGLHVPVADWLINLPRDPPSKFWSGGINLLLSAEQQTGIRWKGGD